MALTPQFSMIFSGTQPEDLVVAWSTSAPAIATVSPAGYVKGISQGVATITLTSYGKSDTIAVQVGPPAPALGVSGVIRYPTVSASQSDPGMSGDGSDVVATRAAQRVPRKTSMPLH